MRLTLALALAVVLAAPRALADEPSDDKKRGHQAMMDMNYGEALDFYEKALAASPEDASLHYNIGRAHQAREEYPEALDALERFEREATPEVRAKVPALVQLIADVRARVGTLRVACSAAAPRARVIIGEKIRIEGCGPSPATVRISVARSGPVEVRLEDETHVAQAAHVAVEGGGRPADVTLVLAPKESSGILVVRVTPGSAVVAVDQVDRGNQPLELRLPAGSHVVDVRSDGYHDAHVPFVLRAGEAKDLSLTLDKKAPITTKWWFWTGVGVVALGAAAAGYVLVAQPEREPSKGTIDPGLVRQSLILF